MNKKTLLFFFLLASSLRVLSQDSLFTVQLTDYVKDERFGKYQVTLALFLVQNDTILSMDFENLLPTKPIIIKKPDGYQYYAYGYIFFPGSTDPHNQGYVPVLVCNPYTKHPHLFVDYNHNYNFTDDPRFTLPYFYEPGVLVELPNAKNPEAKIAVLLTRSNLFGKYELKQQMNDYYNYFYKNRKFVGFEYTYREQRFITRGGILKSAGDSFRIALYDGNSNGLYNDVDTDKVIIVNYSDTVFDALNDLSCITISKQQEKMAFDKNGKIFEVLETDPTGRFVKLKLSNNNNLLLGKVAEGKKVPKFEYTTWSGEKRKIKKLRKYNVYMYFTSEGSTNFEADTTYLRQIALLDSTKLKVILFLYVNKSYRLKIFGTRAKADYMLALGTRDINKQLGINGLPQSLWIGKRRKVIKYGLTPEAFLKVYSNKK